MADVLTDELDGLIENDHDEGIRQFLKKKAPKDVKDMMTRATSLRTPVFPLAYAIQKRRRRAFTELLDAFLKVRADPNIADDTGNTPLHYAVQSRESFYILAVLRIPGVNILAMDADGTSPFVMYLRTCDEPTVVECLEAFVGLQNNVLDLRIGAGRYKGDFPLNMCFQNPRACGMLLETLLAMGAIPDSQNFSGECPLLFAVQRQRLDLVLMLLRKGANIYTMSAAGVTPFAAATKHEGPVAALFALINDINLAMRREFSLVAQYELPRVIGIDLFNDYGAAQQMRHMVVAGIKPTQVEAYNARAGPLKAAFAAGPNAFDLTAPEVIEHVEPEEKIDTRALELVGVYVNHRGKFGLRFLGDFVKVRYKGQLVGLQFVGAEYAAEVKQRLSGGVAAPGRVGHHRRAGLFARREGGAGRVWR